MSIKSFLELVELRTKAASVIPFLLGTFYAIFHFERFDLKNFLLMFISLILFDMATTATNNYYDYKKAKKTTGYNYERHNPVVSYNLNERAVVATIISMVAVASIFGILLFLNTNIVVLIIGVISFGVGILYSFGPIPISRMPLGELVSGIFMGLIIVFLAAYIHVYGADMVGLTYANAVLNININMEEVLYILLFSIPTVNSVANIMLANNICDMEDDFENRRFTLPIYIGKDKALKVFKVLYYVIYMDLIVLIVLKVEPIVSLLTLITLVPVNKNIKLFYEKQTKKDTFVLSVKSFIIINFVRIICFILVLIFRKLMV